MSSASTASEVVDSILEANLGRKPGRLRRKLRLMAENAFAFFRGTDHLYARAWSSLSLRDPGPVLLLCGDLHLENFGAFRTEAGELRFDVNDFDESIFAPCSFDLIRCTTSILLAAEQWGMTPTQGTGMVLAYLENYRDAIAAWDRDRVVGEIATGGEHDPITHFLGSAALLTQSALLDRQTRAKPSGRRVLVRSKQHPDVGKKRAKLVGEAVERHGATIGHPDAFEVLDLTARVAGIGSLGVRRYLVLVRGDEASGGNRLLDVKEALPSTVKACEAPGKAASFADEAHRVVASQVHLQGNPAAGLAAIEVDGRPFRLREMIPQENRSSLDRFREDPRKLRKAVEVAGRLTAWSQIRGAWLDDADDGTTALIRWTQGTALESLVAAAVRDANRTIREYGEFRREYKAGRVEIPAES